MFVVKKSENGQNMRFIKIAGYIVIVTVLLVAGGLLLTGGIASNLKPSSQAVLTSKVSPSTTSISSSSTVTPPSPCSVPTPPPSTNIPAPPNPPPPCSVPTIPPNAKFVHVPPNYIYGSGDLCYDSHMTLCGQEKN